jgi:hypothetical protein
LETFDGSQDPSIWLDSIQDVADLYDLSDGISLKIAKIKLAGPARSWARCRQFADWFDFQQQLDFRYGESRASAISRLERCWQHPTESVRDFADRYLQDAERAGRIEDETLVYNFTQRLLPELKFEVARQRLGSIAAIVNFCNFWADMLAPPDENAPYADTPADPTAISAAAPFSTGYTQHPEPCDTLPYRPPLRDKANKGQPSSRSHHWPLTKATHPPVVVPPMTTVFDPVVEELTQKFERFELNLFQQMRDKDREIRTLRYALRKEQEESTTTDQLNYISLGWEDDFEDEGDLDQELLASLFATVSYEFETPGSHAKPKHVVVDTPTTQLCNYAGSLSDPAQTQEDSPSLAPPQCQPFGALSSSVGTSKNTRSARDLVISLEDFQTIMSPSLKPTLNYNMLFDRDVIAQPCASIDYDQGKPLVQGGPTCTQEVDARVADIDMPYPSSTNLSATCSLPTPRQIPKHGAAAIDFAQANSYTTMAASGCPVRDQCMHALDLVSNRSLMPPQILLAGHVPPPDVTPTATALEQINVLEEVPRRPTGTSAEIISHNIHTWTKPPPNTPYEPCGPPKQILAGHVALGQHVHKPPTLDLKANPPDATLMLSLWKALPQPSTPG